MALIFNFLSILTVGILAVFYLSAVNFSWFWIYPWIDIPIHIMGGLTLGLWACAVASRFNTPPKKAFAYIVIMLLCVGFVWETWEYQVGITSGEFGYWFDTVKDIGDDLLGGTLAAIVYATMRKRT